MGTLKETTMSTTNGGVHERRASHLTNGISRQETRKTKGHLGNIREAKGETPMVGNVHR